MEPVGIPGLPPLLSSITSVTPVAIPESGSDTPMSNLTELVTVRTAKQTTAAQCLLAGEPAETGSSGTPARAEISKGSPMPQQQTPQSASKDAVSPAATPPGPSPSLFPIPPHLLGRTLENPCTDPVNAGRKLQKPRLGVKVPHRNLTSQIVTQNELAQELLERSIKKLPVSTEEFKLAKTAGYSFFSKKLAERLSRTLDPGTAKLSPAPESPITLKKSLFDARLSPGFTYQPEKPPPPPSSGDAELLSILEGDGDPLWLPDKLVKSEHVASKSRRHSPPPPVVLDPALERELALKQLEQLPRDNKRRVRAEKNDTPKKPRGNKRKREEMDSSVDETVTVNGEEPTPGKPAEIATPVEKPTPGKPAAPATPVEKSATRKKKMSPDVAAVLKKQKQPSPKAKKSVSAAAVTNGKAPKNQPAILARKTPKVVLKKKGAKPAKNLVANGTAPGTKKRGRPPKNRPVVGKPVPVSSAKKSAKVQPSPKTSKPGTPTTASKKAQAQSKSEVKLEQKNVENESELVEAQPKPVEVAEAQPKPVEEGTNRGEVEAATTAPVTPRVRELDRLLGDEGAVNMLLDVDTSGSTGAPSRRAGPSQDIALRARLVKTAVLRLSQTTQGHVPLALRARRSLAVNPPRLSRMVGDSRKRQSSIDSREAPRSPPSLTPMDVSPSHHVGQYNSKVKLTADASRIIRRHSSSSSFSSPSVSPRRLSLDLDNDLERERDGDPPSARKKGVPIFVRNSAETTYSGKKKPRVVNPAAVDSTALSLSESARKLVELQCKEIKMKKIALVRNPAALKKTDLKKISSQVKNKVKSEMFKNFKKGLDGAVVIAAKKVASAGKVKKVVEVIRKADVVKAQLQEAMETDAPTSNIASGASTPPPSTSRVNPSLKRDMAPVPLSPDASSYSNLIKTLKHDQKTRRVVEDRQRASNRHCAGTYTYRELTVRRYDNVVQIVMAPVSTKIRGGLNVQVLRELRDALHQVKKDETCRVVLLTSAGASFCQGIDVSFLLHNNVDKRKAAAIDMIVALKDFLKCLASFPKPLVAGVHGPAVGLGVTMLPLFDMVFASDKATFHTPYARLGQVPEGAATLTLPYMLGYTLTSELLLGSREMTASEALNCGLVTRTLWPDRFLEELIPLVKTFATQSAQSMEATKALLRHGLRTKFDAALESESHLLVTHWTSQECQDSLRRWLESGSVALQRPRLPDA